MVVIVFQPAVSVGNVGQLAADLIISTLDMVRVGHFHTDCLIPMTGNNPYSSSEEDASLLSTNAEGQIKKPTETQTDVIQEDRDVSFQGKKKRESHETE